MHLLILCAQKTKTIVKIKSKTKKSNEINNRFDLVHILCYYSLIKISKQNTFTNIHCERDRETWRKKNNIN